MAGKEMSPWSEDRELLAMHTQRLERLEKAQERLEVRVEQVHQQQYAQEVVVKSLRELADRILTRIRAAQSERRRDAASIELAIGEIARKVRFQSVMISWGFGTVIALLSIKIFWS